jgi:hyperosmotically inducible protein
MSKTIRIFTVLAALSLVAGCKRSENTADNTSGRSERDATTTATPTSRDTNDSSRVYSSQGGANASSSDANNTGRNARDRSGDTVTPGDQSNNQSDLDITRGIRRALSTNDQFSTDAKNIKVITANGKVTLRGPVKSEQEKQAVRAAAQSAAGNATVDDQLEVKTENQ